MVAGVIRMCRLDLVMAFSIKFTGRYEYRGDRTGVSTKTGKPWRSLIFEDDDSSQVEVSVPSGMLQDVEDLELAKGDVADVTFRATARGDGSSYVMLLDVPVIVCDKDGLEVY